MLDEYMLVEWKTQTKYTILWEAWCLVTLELMFYINILGGYSPRHCNRDKIYNGFTEIHIFEQGSGEGKLLPSQDMEKERQCYCAHPNYKQG